MRTIEDQYEYERHRARFNVWVFGKREVNAVMFRFLAKIGGQFQPGRCIP